MNYKLFLFLALAQTLFSCEGSTSRAKASNIVIVSLSELPDPNTIPYPNGASVCLCKNELGDEILVALEAIKGRKLISHFSKLEKGSKIVVTLIPWNQRPEKARAMAIANDFQDHYDLLLYFGEVSDTPK